MLSRIGYRRQCGVAWDVTGVVSLHMVLYVVSRCGVRWDVVSCRLGYRVGCSNMQDMVSYRTWCRIVCGIV